MSEHAGPRAEPHDRSASEFVDELVLDRIDSLKVLRADTQSEKDLLLEQIAGRGKPEQDIVRQLAAIRPLWRPDRFEEAHRWAMRALEVLDRNGSRQPELRRLGPLRPVAAYVVQMMTRYIVKGYQNRLITAIRRQYERREANSAWGTAEHSMLRRARLDAARVEPGYKGNPLGLPTFQLGGAVLSSLVSGLRALVDWAFKGGGAIIVFTAVVGVVFLGLAWCALHSAGVARRRIRLSTEQPMKALWETVGAAGNPPRDNSYDFAVYSIVLLVLAWILVPTALAVFLSHR